ncbi:hypothetical protein GYMLUDRAFT_1024416, partial [Collybiopsis luxurians FD-317 M1]
LVSKLSGQFVYPSTVFKYINDNSAVPADRLDIVLGIQKEETEGEALLSLMHSTTKFCQQTRTPLHLFKYLEFLLLTRM